jgi:putative transposase
VIKFHPDWILSTHWVGVDLNTTGHVAVAADLTSGKVIKLGKNIHYAQSQSSQNCTKFWKDGKLWKLKKIKSRERKNFRAAVSKISRQIVSFAESLGSGIKFERLFSDKYCPKKEMDQSFEFSFRNGSFFSLQRQVEKRAMDQGIPVMYVDPYSTSKRCSKCGCPGKRFRKRFECPHCGYVTHADVNAAFNIAATSVMASSQGLQMREENSCRDRKKMRRLARAASGPAAGAITSCHPIIEPENLLAVLEQT